MIFLQDQDHGCVYTLDEDSQELYYAPIYVDNSVNLSEFHPVDLYRCDHQKEVLKIQEQLIALNSSK